MAELIARFYSVSYEVRVLGVLAALGVMALWDGIRHRDRATRWREYAFWTACGCIGALFGVINDTVTATASKAYFVIGKGLPEDPARFSTAVMALGARAGSFAGIVVGGVVLVANKPDGERPQLSYRALVKYLSIVMLTAVVVGIALGALSGWDVQGLAPTIREMVTGRELKRFLAVQRVHVGLYSGAAFATIASAVMIRSVRRVK